MRAESSMLELAPEPAHQAFFSTELAGMQREKKAAAQTMSSRIKGMNQRIP